MAEFDLNLRDIFRIFRRRKWVIVLSPIAVATLSYLLSTQPDPEYQAEALLKVSRVATSMNALLIEAMTWYQGDNIATQSEIITSQKIRIRTAVCLAENHPEFEPLRSSDGEQADYAELEERVRREPELLALVEEIDVATEQKGDSDVVGIQASAGSAMLAVDIVNCTAEEFVKYNAAEKNSQIREAVRFIRERIQEVEGELVVSERRLREFKTDNVGVLGLSMDDTAGVQDRFSRLVREIATLERGIGQLQKIKNVDQYFAFSPALTEIQDPLIGQLEVQLLQQVNQVNDLKGERHRLLRYRTDKANDVQQNIVQTEELERRVEETISSLIRRYEAIRDQLAEEHQSLVEYQDKVSGAPELATQLESLERQVALKSDALDLFQRRLQDAEIQNAGEVREISIVESAAEASLLPQQSRTLKAMVGLLIGLILGGIFSVVLESLDTSIGTIEDVEKYVQLPVLGVIPHMDREKIQQSILTEEMGSDVTSRELDRMAVLCTHFTPKEPVSESFRTMRAHLEVLFKNNNWKTLLMTSSVLQEGKTSTATNLAVVFAQSGQKTILIDADLRRPQVNQVFGLSRGPGLTEVLLGVTDLEEATRSINDLILGNFGLKNSHMTPGLEYLSVMTSGRKVDNPAELLSFERFTEMLSTIRDQYDVIIVDAAPVLPVADASQLAPAMDATLLGYQIGRAGREVVSRSKARLSGVGGNVVGLVMNDIEAEIQYTRDYEYYSYGYKYEESTPSKPPGLLSRLKGGLSNLGRSSESQTKAAGGWRPSMREEPQKPQKRQSQSPPSSEQEMEDIMKLTDDEE